MDPGAKLQPEKEGCEFGTYCFEEVNESGEILPDFWIKMIEHIEHIKIAQDEEQVREVRIPYTSKQMVQLQKKNAKARKIVENLHKEKNRRKVVYPTQRSVVSVMDRREGKLSDAYLFQRY